MAEQWIRELAEAWDELHEGQRLARATCLVDYGLDKGKTLDAIAKATESSAYPIGRTAVAAYIDLYAVQAGALSTGPIVAGPDRLKHAMNLYEPDVSKEEVQEYAQEHGYSDIVAKKMLEGKQIGAAMAEEGVITDDGELRISDPRTTHAIEGEDAYGPVRTRPTVPTAFRWSQGFTRYSGQFDEFFSFLKATKQDAMSDKVIAPRLRRMAEQLERQADRFATGYEKCAAKTRAKESKGV